MNEVSARPDRHVLRPQACWLHDDHQTQQERREGGPLAKDR